MKEGTRLKLRQLTAIAVGWVAMGLLITVYDYLVLKTWEAAGASPSYSFVLALVRNVGSALLGAALGGTLLVFYVNEKLQDKPYGYTILVVAATLLFVVALISVAVGLVLVPQRTARPLSDPVTQAAIWRFMTDASHFKAMMAWSFVVGITQLLLQVASKFGQANFWNIIRGKYNQPVEEEKVFMFLDINDSTAIAERLGDQEYHSLLKDFFADITPAILDSHGSVYQYVGDEVVVVWTYKDGVKNAHCLRCFFDMKAQVAAQKDKYLQRYGLVPAFKAGIHCGRVVAGEVGIIKRDITYSGDVLNTTSRILSKCTEYKAEVIASTDLLSTVAAGNGFVSRPLGVIKLRGKSREVGLASLAMA